MAFWDSIIHGLTGKTTPADNDELPLIDSAAANVGVKLTWANAKAALKSYFDTLYTATGSVSCTLANIAAAIHGATEKTTPVDADELVLVDSAAGNVGKRITWSDIKTALGLLFDAAGAASTVAGNLSTHAGLSTAAHGGIVASNDSRLTDARTPTTHGNDKHSSTYITAADVAGDLPGVNRYLRGTIIDPKGTYGKDHEICLIPAASAALTITAIRITCDADPATELDIDLKKADAFIGMANAVVLRACDTTSGTHTATGLSLALASGKALYWSFGGEPDAAITQMSYEIVYDFD